MTGITLQSAAFTDGAPIPRRYGRDGDDVHPPLRWSTPPNSTEELVLLCEDPDAPSGTFVHWLVTGIDPESEGVDTGEVPSGGTEHVNGFGERGWGGPLPPVGDDPHRYRFRLYAMPEPVSLPERASADEVHRVVERGGLADGTLTGFVQR